MQTRRSFLRTSLAATTAILADVSSIAAKERPSLDGVKFLTPDASDYATAREVYNAGILTQPKIIACCTSETGVQHALERAKAENSAWIMNGSQVTMVVITIGSCEEKGLVAFRRQLTGLTKKVTSGGP